jgi:hypothetical protein
MAAPRKCRRADKEAVASEKKLLPQRHRGKKSRCQMRRQDTKIEERFFASLGMADFLLGAGMEDEM